MKVQDAIEMLQDLLDDGPMPKNVRARIEKTLSVLKEKEGEHKIKVSRALHELEDISNDTNMQADTRTQIFNVVSVLEVV